MQQADTGDWLAFEGLQDTLSAAAPVEVPALLTTLESRVRHEGLHAVGFVSYEAASGFDAKLSCHAPGVLPPAWFALFDACRPVAAPPPGPPPNLHWQPSLSQVDYTAAIARIHDYIGAGDTYQVNFSYRLRAEAGPAQGRAVAGAGAEDLFHTMVAGQRTGLGAFIDTDDWAICSASPELFFARRGRRLESRPMKGTASRAAGDADQAQARWLAGSAKNRAENTMITDMVRNDLGRIADTGSVATGALFRIEAYPTVWQMTSSVSGATDAGLAEVFRALFPAASITGAPKRRTMEIIRELEPTPREIYTGAIGYLAPNGDAQFNVAIRTALVDKHRGRAEYGVGGGIVWDSRAAEEHAETRAKAQILHRRPAEDAAFDLLETLLWTPERGYALLEDHLDRMTRSAARFRRPFNRRTVLAALHQATAGLPATAQRVRLLVDRCGQPTVSAHPLDGSPAPRRLAIARQGLAVAGNPFVHHKTTRRDVYETARREALAGAAADDVLLVNLAGEVTESTIANLVVDLDGVLVTPPLAAGLLPGLYRAQLLAAGTVVEHRLTPADVRRARAVYLVNSVRGMWPVTVV
jgi:para-aminobenzoate synthetase/4-amino-4-deoxychorismate lyase